MNKISAKKIRQIAKSKGKSAKSWKEAYDRVRCHESFRRYMSGHFFKGVKFIPLNSSEVKIYQDLMKISTVDGMPCISIIIDDVDYHIFYKGKTAEVLMTNNQKTKIEGNMIKHDIQKNMVTSIAKTIKNIPSPRMV